MGIFKNSRVKKIIQGQSRNQAALAFLVRVGFGLPEVRASLVRLNRINVSSLARNGRGVTVPSLYAAISGERRNRAAREVLAEALKVPVAELFPDE